MTHSKNKWRGRLRRRNNRREEGVQSHNSTFRCSIKGSYYRGTSTGYSRNLSVYKATIQFINYTVYKVSQWKTALCSGKNKVFRINLASNFGFLPNINQ
jgi:hypothetical protein